MCDKKKKWCPLCAIQGFAPPEKPDDAEDEVCEYCKREWDY